jgi:hypothetical protein
LPRWKFVVNRNAMTAPHARLELVDDSGARPFRPGPTFEVCAPNGGVEFRHAQRRGRGSSVVGVGLFDERDVGPAGPAASHSIQFRSSDEEGFAVSFESRYDRPSTTVGPSVFRSVLRSAFRRVESRQVQSLFREVNEQIVAMVEEPSDGRELELVCECSSPSCLATYQISVADYEAVRRFPTRFIVKPGHVSLDSERVVEEGLGFVVVEKRGPGALAAIRLDPRRRRLASVHIVVDRSSADGDSEP